MAVKCDLGRFLKERLDFQRAGQLSDKAFPVFLGPKNHGGQHRTNILERLRTASIFGVYFAPSPRPLRNNNHEGNYMHQARTLNQLCENPSEIAADPGKTPSHL